MAKFGKVSKPQRRGIKECESMATSYHEQETLCEHYFWSACKDCGPFWHYCTPGQLNESINIKEDDFKFSVNNLAISAAESGVHVITDAHMTNHIHALLECYKAQCFDFEDRYLYRLKKYLALNGRKVDLSGFRCNDPIPVTDLSMMRNEIVYINRNGYVADSRYTPFSYPWGGGSVYFNSNNPRGVPFISLSYKEKRAISMRSAIEVPDGYRYSDGLILPSSYLDYRFGESLFRDAHHYFSHLTKKMESFSETAKRLGDKVILTEEEMFNAARMLAESKYGVKQATLLPPSAKIEVAKALRFDYNAGAKQIQRLLKLDLSLVKELFPSATPFA